MFKRKTKSVSFSYPVPDMRAIGGGLKESGKKLLPALLSISTAACFAGGVMALVYAGHQLTVGNQSEGIRYLARGAIALGVMAYTKRVNLFYVPETRSLEALER